MQDISDRLRMGILGVRWAYRTDAILLDTHLIDELAMEEYL